MIRIISLDIDGTLVDFRFNEVLWDEAIPHLYSKKHGVPSEDAKKKVTSEYRKISQSDPRWYNASFWCQHLGIGTVSDLTKDLARHVKIYPDVLPALQKLCKKYKLIAVSNGTKETTEIKLKAEGLENFFVRPYYVLDMIGGLKNPDAFASIVKDLGVGANEIVHIGDDADFDYAAPRASGLHALLLTRGDRHPALKNNAMTKVLPEHIIKDLGGLQQRIGGLS